MSGGDTAVDGNAESGVWYDCPLYGRRVEWTEEAFAAHFPCPQFGPAGSCHPGPPYSGESWCETHGKMLTDCLRDKDREIARLKAEDT